MPRNGAADTLRPASHQGDGSFGWHFVFAYYFLSRSTGRSGREPHSAQEPS